MNSNRAAAVAWFLLRVVAGLLFMQHGGQKLFGWFGGMPGGPVHLMSQLGAAGVIEFFGGLLVLVGLFTRPAAFLMSGEMAVAYFQSHFPHGFWPLQNHGEPAVLYCFIFLLFAAGGAGAYALDALLFRRRPHS